jgi:hypothetical protein
MTKYKLIPVTVIKKHGWEYYLVDVYRPPGTGISQPCFMGMEGYALKGCKKICNDKTKKN